MRISKVVNSTGDETVGNNKCDEKLFITVEEPTLLDNSSNNHPPILFFSALDRLLMIDAFCHQCNSQH